MPSTSFNISTALATILSSATTWANTRGASLEDPLSLVLFNPSAIQVRVTDNSAATTATIGMPLLSSGYRNEGITREGRALFAFTTASTATLIGETDR